MSMSLPHICEATDFGTRTACGRCAITWFTDAKQRPSCKPKADPPIGLAEMIEAQREEAYRIHASQRAIIAAGYAPHPFMGELRKAAVFLATANLLERVRDTPKAVEALKGAGT